MESPSPLPSVWRLLSPRTKRSIRSSAEMFSSLRETFLMLTVASCSSAAAAAYTRVPGIAYLHMLFIRLSITRLSSLPSAITAGSPAAG